MSDSITFMTMLIISCNFVTPSNSSKPPNNHSVLFCSVLFSVATLQVLMGVMSSRMDDLCVCIENVADSPKRQEEAMNTGRQFPCSFRQGHGLFYVPTGKRDRRLNVPSE